MKNITPLTDSEVKQILEAESARSVDAPVSDSADPTPTPDIPQETKEVETEVSTELESTPAEVEAVEEAGSAEDAEDEVTTDREVVHLKSNDPIETAASPLDLIKARSAAPGTFSVDDVIDSRAKKKEGLSVQDLIAQRSAGCSGKPKSVKDLIYERKYRK